MAWRLVKIVLDIRPVGYYNLTGRVGGRMKYRKKPVVVEAVQWFKLGDHPLVSEYKSPYKG